jgi:hypothetical protein
MLTAAIVACDVDGVRQALAQDANPNARREMVPGELTFQPTTPLRQVLFHANEPSENKEERYQAFTTIAALLLDAGADPEDAMIVSWQFAGISEEWDGKEAEGSDERVTIKSVYSPIARAATMQRLAQDTENERHGATSSDISHVAAISFCGSVHRRYNVWSDVCCWAVLAIEDYPADMPNPITRAPSKGESFGMTCWEVLEWMSQDITDMSLVALNDKHPIINADGRLCYLPSEGSLRNSLNRVDKTEWTMAAQLALFHARPDNLLRTWLFQAHPALEAVLDAEPTRLVDIACRGVVSGKHFPSNVVTFLHLPVVREGPFAQDKLPPEAHPWSRNYDVASMPIALQLVLATCARYTMIPTQMLHEVNLVLTFTLVDTTKFEVSVQVSFRDSFYSGFREVGGSDTVLKVHAL